MTYCNFRWVAPRGDTVYESLPVEHVCMLRSHHESTGEPYHYCPCRATTPVKSTAPPG